MSLPALAAFSIVGIRIGNTNPVTDINVAENGPEGRIVGEVVLSNLDPAQTYTFSFASPEAPDVEIDVPFGIIAGTGADAGKYFLKLLDGVALDFEGPGAPSFLLRVVDGNNESAAQVISVTVDDVNEAPSSVIIVFGDNGGTTITVIENGDPGRDIGLIVGGDPEQDQLTYNIVLADG